MNEYRKRLEVAREKCTIAIGESGNITKNIQVLKTENESNLLLVEDKSKQSMLLEDLTVIIRQKSIDEIEKVVTDALQYSMNDSSYKLKIELGSVGDTNKKPEARYIVGHNVENKYQEFQLKDDCGGTIVDIVSTVLRYAYGDVLEAPKINNTYSLDEPGKMISENISNRFAIFLKKIGQIFNKSTIIVTHNIHIRDNADKAIYVKKINGVSKAVSMEDYYKDENNKNKKVSGDKH